MGTIHEVVMPSMGESIHQGTITKWHVVVGDLVERDQPLFDISTDKVDAEIPSPATGVLRQILHPAGTTVPVNRIVAWIAADMAEPVPEVETFLPAPSQPAAPTHGPNLWLVAAIVLVAHLLWQIFMGAQENKTIYGLILAAATLVCLLAWGWGRTKQSSNRG